jgi:type III pantothenate kinase
VLLSIDVGNLNVKVGIFDGPRLLDTWRLAPDPRRTADEYGALLLSLMQHRGATGAIKGVVIGSVVPRMDTLLNEACGRYLGVQPLVVTPRVNMGLEVKTDFPDEVGVDLLAGVVAAKHFYGQPIMTLHLGTAAVLNAVSAEGAFIGCAIAPGPDAMLEGLVGKATKLPFIPLDLPPTALGTNTVTSMQSGVMMGFVALVEGLIKRFRAELGDWQVVATGGYASMLASHTDTVNRVDPDLILQGLRLIYEMNA